MDPKDKIIVALDVDRVDKALALVGVLSPHVGLFKIGLEFINSMLASLIAEKDAVEAHENLQSVRRLFALLEGKIFWDDKFDDIPNTVEGAAKSVAKIGVKMFNVHASAGIRAMQAAVVEKKLSLVLAVTVLTSLDDNATKLIYGDWSAQKVQQFAFDAKFAGCDGLICSPQELLMLRREEHFNTMLKVIPGIRPADSPADDQKRTMTAEEAMSAGADYLVIGRPITDAPNLPQAAQKFAEEIRLGLVARR